MVASPSIYQDFQESNACAEVCLCRWVVAPGFEGVAEAFRQNFTRDEELGAAFAAVKDGEPVVDIWGGLADHETGDGGRRTRCSWSFPSRKGCLHFDQIFYRALNPRKKTADSVYMGRDQSARPTMIGAAALNVFAEVLYFLNSPR